MLPISDMPATGVLTDVRSSSPSAVNPSIQKLQSTIPIAPAPVSALSHDYEQGSFPLFSPLPNGTPELTRVPCIGAPRTPDPMQPDLRLGELPFDSFFARVPPESTRMISMETISRCTGSTSTMIVPSTPPNVKTATAVYDDTDDDDLSDISERSREEDVSDPVVTKSSTATSAGPVDASVHKSFSEPLKAPLADSSAPVSTVSSEDKQATVDKERVLPGPSKDADRQQFTFPPANTKTVTPARQIEHSDSDEATSEADARVARPPLADVFYSPNESVDIADDNDDQRSSGSLYSARTHVDLTPQSTRKLAVSPARAVDPLQKGKNSGSQDDTDDEKSSTASESSESQHTPTQTGRTALGEPSAFAARW